MELVGCVNMAHVKRKNFKPKMNSSFRRRVSNKYNFHISQTAKSTVDMVNPRRLIWRRH